MIFADLFFSRFKLCISCDIREASKVLKKDEKHFNFTHLSYVHDNTALLARVLSHWLPLLSESWLHTARFRRGETIVMHWTKTLWKEQQCNWAWEKFPLCQPNLTLFCKFHITLVKRNFCNYAILWLHFSTGAQEPPQSVAGVHHTCVFLCYIS